MQCWLRESLRGVIKSGASEGVVRRPGGTPEISQWWSESASGNHRALQRWETRPGRGDGIARARVCHRPCGGGHGFFLWIRWLRSRIASALRRCHAGCLRQAISLRSVRFTTGSFPQSLRDQERNSICTTFYSHPSSRSLRRLSGSGFLTLGSQFLAFGSGFFVCGGRFLG